MTTTQYWSIDLTCQVLTRTLGERDEYSIAGQVLTWDNAEGAAKRLGLHCLYFAPNDYYTFSRKPFEHRRYGRIVR